jgi:ribosomal protein S18 acetylase RimI-like enzyme
MPIEIDHVPPLAEMKELLREYPASIPVPLEAADYEQWLDTLPGPYSPPLGALLVARCDGAAAGCVCLRPLGDGSGEIKRMYIRESFRGRRVARTLLTECITIGQTAGFKRLRLDTHSTMTPARTLYESAGFVEIAPYWDHPIPNVVFYELAL